MYAFYAFLLFELGLNGWIKLLKGEGENGGNKSHKIVRKSKPNCAQEYIHYTLLVDLFLSSFCRRYSLRIWFTATKRVRYQRHSRISLISKYRYMNNNRWFILSFLTHVSIILHEGNIYHKSSQYVKFCTYNHKDVQT